MDEGMRIEEEVERRARRICAWAKIDPDEITDEYGPCLQWHNPAYHLNEIAQVITNALAEKDAEIARLSAEVKRLESLAADHFRNAQRLAARCAALEATNGTV